MRNIPWTTTKKGASTVDLISNPWMEPLYAFRRELGLPRGLHPVFEGQHSPQLNLALFSKLLCEPQPDWPPNTHVTGFPFYDKQAGAPIAPELQHFLDQGPAPAQAVGTAVRAEHGARTAVDLMLQLLDRTAGSVSPPLRTGTSSAAWR